MKYKHQWRCRYCLTIRSSRLNYRWPKVCSGLFKQTVLPAKPPQLPALFGGEQHFSNTEADTHRSAAADEVAHPSAVNPLDDPEVMSPADVDELDYVEMEPPDEDTGADFADLLPAASSSSAIAPMPTAPTPSTSWWNRLGQHIAASELRVGGATIHPSHWVAHFGNEEHRLVFCPRCGGSTAGAHSPLLADACRRHCTGTLGRHVHRMTAQEQWPTKIMRQSWGRATCSPALKFVTTALADTYVIAGADSGGVHSEPPPAAEGSQPWTERA